MAADQPAQLKHHHAHLTPLLRELMSDMDKKLALLRMLLVKSTAEETLKFKRTERNRSKAVENNNLRWPRECVMTLRLAANITCCVTKKLPAGRLFPSLEQLPVDTRSNLIIPVHS